MRNIITLLFVLIVTLIISGCGGDRSRPTDLPKLYPSIITVTQEGQPLADAYVELVAADGNDGKYQSGAYTDVSGRAVVRTYAQLGVPAGRYKIIVTKSIEGDFVYGKDEYGDQTLLRSTSYKTVEPKYSDAKTTPHEIEITGKEKNVEQTFDVGKAVKIKVSAK